MTQKTKKKRNKGKEKKERDHDETTIRESSGLDIVHHLILVASFTALDML
jgi:hypothetical protein